MRLEADLWLDGNRTFLMSRQQRGPGLVAAALLKHFNDRHRQRLLPQSAGELVARRLTTATRLGADPAVLVHAGVALTIGCASPAGSPARLDECLGEARIKTGVAERTVPVVAQTAAQSRSVRMHWTSSDTMCSARQASAHAVQACAQSKHASMHSVSFARSSSPQSFGWDSNICSTCDMAISYGCDFRSYHHTGDGVSAER